MKILYNSTFLAIILLIAISAPALKSLAQNGLYTSHDGETHTARIAQYYLALQDFQIPPRIAPTLYSSLGSPMFVYIYPAPYFLGAAIHSLGISYQHSFKILMAFGFIFSGVFSYLWLKEIFKSQKAALVGAIFYIWAPYRLSLIYVRGSISELLAYTFTPLVFYSVTKLSKKLNIKWTAITALSTALLLLSQNLVAMIILPVVGTYILALAISKKSPKFFALATLSIIWAAAIASLTYLPSLLEKHYVRLEEIIAVAYPDHFISLKQLIYSPWGYGFDLVGVVGDQMSFQLGLAHILVLTMATSLIIFFAACVLVHKNFLNSYLEVDSKTLNLSALFLLIFAFSIFLAIKSSPSIYIWKNIDLLSVIDLPWRLLGVTTLSVAFLAAYVAKSVKITLFSILLIAAVLVANRNHLRINEKVLFSDEYFENYSQSATQYGEFTPKTRHTTNAPEDFNKSEFVDIDEGIAKVRSLENKSNKIILVVNVETLRARMRLNRYYFPGWEIKVDGRKLEPHEITVTGSSYKALNWQKDMSGLMAIRLPAGTHLVEAKFTETRLRALADLITFVSLTAALFVALRYAKT
ncbi:MAG: 6-pyruvoyl-tetrahydropterin synthase-related protein [Candidatus Curtissbacteria bacterium]|nr:6-pyruvoyl-tetrahydropterin synthase-related protein [Candidatus Curtissbacteria bacterium]